MIRKKYLESRIAEAGHELQELEVKIGYNPYPSRPNVVQPQEQPAMDIQSVAARSEFTDATKVTYNREEEKAALKDLRKANEGTGTINDIDESFICPHFSTRWEIIIYLMTKPMVVWKTEQETVATCWEFLETVHSFLAFPLNCSRHRLYEWISYTG